MRSRLGALGAAAVLAIAGVSGMVASPAGAQTQPVFSCSYIVGPTALPPGGGFITVQGTAPGSSVVRIFADGVLVAVTSSAPVTGAFSASIFVTRSVEISVALDDYPNTPCIGTGGSGAGQGAGGGTAASRLALTGSSDTGATVRLGLAALGLGLVLVVAARRRVGVRGRG